jgi:hypothetical protein
MNEVYLNLLLFAIILLGLYFFFRNYDMHVNREGLENQESSSSINGIAGNSQTYLTFLRDLDGKIKDSLNISNAEYRKNYEDIILSMDDLINNIMLKTTLTINKSKPEETIIKLSQLNQARAALNNVLKFVDKQ